MDFTSYFFFFSFFIMKNYDHAKLLLDLNTTKELEEYDFVFEYDGYTLEDDLYPYKKRHLNNN